MAATASDERDLRPRTVEELQRRTDELLQPPICRRCKRVAVGWPLERGDRCSPREWGNCLRDPWTVLMENAAGVKVTP